MKKFEQYPPYIHDWKTSAKSIWICTITLLPLVLWSLYLYGFKVAFIWLSSIVSAIAAEAIVSIFTKKLTISDGSAVLTGLLLAAIMPPTIPVYIPCLSAAFAILVVKAPFGGLGSNWMNPAVAGAAFAYLNWPKAMHEFVLPRIITGVDGISASSPLSFARGLNTGIDINIMDALKSSSYPLSGIDIKITGLLNNSIFSFLGAHLPDGYIDLSLGFKPGALGESALIVVIIGSVFLISLKIIKTIVPLTMLFVFSVLVWLFGTGLPGEGLFRGDVLFALFNGGVLLAAFYMAPEPVSSPCGKIENFIYGIFLGLLCYVFRRWAARPEGAVYAILIMNVLGPSSEKLIDTIKTIITRKRLVHK